MIAKQIKKDLTVVLKKLKISPKKLVLEHPLLRQSADQGKLDHGDYSTNVAMIKFQKARLTARQGKTGFLTPVDLANKIVNTWRSLGLPEYLAKIEVAPPGFINLKLSPEFLSTELVEVLKKGKRYGRGNFLKGKRILLEHTSPNPQTTIMLGHLRNNFLGMAAANILEFQGAKVVKDCVVNDRGVHICKAIWGYLVFGQKKSKLTKSQLLNFKKIPDGRIKALGKKIDWSKSLEEWTKKKSSWLTPKDLRLKSDHANLIWYVLGSRAYDLSEKVRQQVEEILLAWEAEDKGVWQVWKQILDWSTKGYQETYKRVGSIHDWVWRESDHYKQGKEIVKLGLKKGVFRKSEGAIVTNLANYGLPDTVVVKVDGTALYITQDLALTKLKTKQFPSDLYIWDIGEEQSLYFKQLFAICEQLGIGSLEKFFHLSCALINFKGGGKMATRKGEVVKADEILDELEGRALEIIKNSNQKLRGKLTKSQLNNLAEKVALGAIKYSLLKFGRETTIYFDIDESLALEGNSGPYLQYTFARCRSVLRRAGISNFSFDPELRTEGHFPISNLRLTNEEISILRTIYKFPEVVAEAGENYSPNLICNFLFDLAQKYNLFYNKLPILKAESPEFVEGRLALTAAVDQIIKSGLNLLGIATPERM